MNNNTKEFINLRSALQNVNIYEKNMSLEEMRALMKVLQLSMMDCEDYSLGPVHLDQNDWLSSTVIDAHSNDTNTNYKKHHSPMSLANSSDAEEPKKFNVVAEIHHHQDWSPISTNIVDSATINRKRAADNNDVWLNGPTAAKRALMSNTFNNPNDSGIKSNSSASDSSDRNIAVNLDRMNVSEF